MASTVDLGNLTEYQDSEEAFQSNIDQLAQLINQSERLLFFTGAGISTSSGIPDFRSKDGVWTRQAQGKAPPSSVKMTEAMPTPCHMGILSLMNDPSKKTFCISQNIDGLHRRSGLRADQIAELHGNLYEEVCWGCGAQYLRPYEIHGGLNGPASCQECLERVPHFCHCTPRKCETCGKRLKDSIIHFKENLPVKAITAGFSFAETADLCIVLGSSCTVSPACLIPKRVAKQGGKLVIINLQKTPLDELCTLRIFAKTDILMIRLFEALGKVLHPFEAAADQVLHPSPASHDSHPIVEVPPVEPFPTDLISQPQEAKLDDDKDDDHDDDHGGYIQPSTHCPHVASAVSSTPLTLDTAIQLLKNGCSECKTKQENWVCLTCLKPHCGRYQAKHAMEHSSKSQHPVAISLMDLNTWCYTCQEYILHESIQPFHIALHLAKFGELPAGCAIEGLRK